MIEELISTIGFPIVAFLLMYRLYTNHLEDMTEVVENNSKVLNEIKTILEERE